MNANQVQTLEDMRNNFKGTCDTQKPDDIVSVSVIDMSSIPPNSNPFHYDQFLMGTSLVRGWMVMHEGFDAETDQKPLRSMVLINTRSGQRIRLLFAPKTDAEILDETLAGCWNQSV